MADTLNKPKLQLRTSFGITVGEKASSPATKLLINHGKPNFTIQKTTKDNETTTPASPEMENNNNNVNKINNNYYPYKTASTVSPIIHNNNNYPVVAAKAKFVESQSEDNEATKVVLRKTPKVPEPPMKEDEDENVPEFIRRQRRIQERLAKENILDFENRRSGYFTHVMISPTSPNRTSFVETMASPAIVPALEIPPPNLKEVQEDKEASQQEEEVKENGHVEQMNGHHHDEELKDHGEGEDQEKEISGVPSDAPAEDLGDVVIGVPSDAPAEVRAEAPVDMVIGVPSDAPAEVRAEAPVDAVVGEPSDAPAEERDEDLVDVFIQVPTNAAYAFRVGNGQAEQKAREEEEVAKAIEEVNKAVAGEDDEKVPVEGLVTAVPATLIHIEPAEPEPEIQSHERKEENQVVMEEQEILVDLEAEPKIDEDHPPKTNGHFEENGHMEQNGHVDEGITISHTNALNDGPHIPSPDPSGALGLNFEPKPMVSFSKDLATEPNKYPDTVVVVKDAEPTSPADAELKELTKVKFDIKADDHDVEVTPVLKTH